jgi:hypothetical protein
MFYLFCLFIPMVVILGSPNEPEKNEGDKENQGQTEADEVAGGHNSVIY